MVVKSLPDHNHLPPEAQQLLHYADALTRSASKIEDDYWERQIIDATNALLRTNKQLVFDQLFQFLDHHALLEHLEILASMIEGVTETLHLEHNSTRYDMLLLCIPFTVWTRFQLPHGPLTPELSANILQALRTHIIRDNVQLHLHPELLSFDQLPQNFCQSRQYLYTLQKQLFNSKSPVLTVPQPLHEGGLLADVQFLLLAASVPTGQAIFQWQSSTGNPHQAQQQAYQQWQAHAPALFQSLFTGCEVYYSLPNAYYTSSREADRHLRPFIIKAAVAWLEQVAHLELDDIIAVIAACGDDVAEEYRIGYSHIDDENKILYGSIWTVLSQFESDISSEDYVDTPAAIAALLTELGIKHVRLLPGMYLPEFCDDCDTPHFPNSAGELVHPDIPEELNLNPLTLH